MFSFEKGTKYTVRYVFKGDLGVYLLYIMPTSEIFY